MCVCVCVCVLHTHLSSVASHIKSTLRPTKASHQTHGVGQNHGYITMDYIMMDILFIYMVFLAGKVPSSIWYIRRIYMVLANSTDTQGWPDPWIHNQ